MNKQINWENVEFKGEKRYLSNMYVTQIKMPKEYKKVFPVFEMYFDDTIYNSSEHIYQLLKFDSVEWISIIKSEMQPHKTKILSRKYLKTDNMVRGEWDIYLKNNAMRIALFLKFSQNKELLKELQNEKGVIEERNDWEDKYWGTYAGEGLNTLGKMLMIIRDHGLNALLKEETNCEALFIKYRRIEKKYEVLRKYYLDKDENFSSHYYDSNLSLFLCDIDKDSTNKLDEVEKNLDKDLKEMRKD